jgi:TonB-linked SusC/RagA family outer membrane protein
MQILKRCLLLSPVMFVTCFTLQSYAQERNTEKEDSAKKIKVGFYPDQQNNPVLFKTQSERLRVQSSAVLDGAELEKSPVFNLNNAFYGKLAGLFVRQSSGDPGDDGATLSLRGLTPIVLVDGIPRSITSINPEQIESVTVLKDGLATAMLGMRSNGGAILITTRKGDGMNSKLNLTANTGWQTPLSSPTPLNAYNYATLYNEALANDGRPLAYTAAQLDAYKNHTNQYLYPDVDWRKTLLRNASKYNHYNLSIGDNAAKYRYFLSLDYLNQQGIFFQSNENSYSTNSEYKRYNIRGNIEVDIDKYLSTSLNIFGRIQDETEPGSIGAATLYNNILSTPANAYPVFNPNGSLGGNQTFQTNLYGQLINSGYQLGFTRDAGVDLTLKRKLDDVVKGLWVKGTLSFYGSLSQSTDRSRAIEVFNMKVGQANDTTYQKYGTRNDQVNTSSTNSWNQQLYAEVTGGYTKSFRKNNLDVLVVTNMQNYRNNPSELPYIFKSVAASIAYNYDQKYILEVAGNYGGNNRFEVGKQAGFFPAIGFGWNVANEDFFKQRLSSIQTFKLRGSYGATGGANPGYYSYNQYYESATGYVIGGSASGVSGYQQADLANPRLRWEKGLKLDLGADLGFWNNKAYLSVDYFHNEMYDLIRQRGTASSLLGTDYPVENIGQNTISGWEFNAGVNEKIGKLNFVANVNVTTLKNTLDYYYEPTRPYPWMMRTGKKSGQIFGLIADGFFKDNQDISNSATTEGYKPVPGDIKYKDLNADGIINTYDETALTTEKPEIYLGTTLSAQYKGFELTVVLNAVKNRDVLLTGLGQYEFQVFGNGYGQAFEQHLNRWTPATAATATYPRLTVGLNTNNHRVSSFWVKNADYLRLRNVELAYTVTNKFIAKAKISGIRLFVNGINLFTVSNLSNVDPEVTSGYPNTRTINAGATVRF